MNLRRSGVALVLGLALLGLPAFSDAASTYSTKKDDKGVSFFEKGMKEVEQGDFEDAIVQFAKAAQADPKNADYVSMLGYSLRKLGNYDAAFANYEKALRLDPGHLGTHEYVGEAYVETGNLEMADRHLARLAELCPQGCAEYDQLAAFRHEHAGEAAD